MAGSGTFSVRLTTGATTKTSPPVIVRLRIISLRAAPLLPCGCACACPELLKASILSWITFKLLRSPSPLTSYVTCGCVMETLSMTTGPEPVMLPVSTCTAMLPR